MANESAGATATTDQVAGTVTTGTDTNKSSAEATKAAAKTSAKKPASKPKAKADGADATAIADTFGGSPVTGTVNETTSDKQEIDLSKAKITVPKEAITAEQAPAKPDLSAEEKAALDAENQTFAVRASDAGIGLIKMLGHDFEYVGLPPALDKDPTTPDGLKISGTNSRFTPLSDVGYSPTLRIKDLKTGQYYFGNPGGSWESATFEGNPLVPAEPSEAHAKYRAAAAYEAKFGVKPE